MVFFFLILNRVIVVISFVLNKTTLIISDSTFEPVTMVSEIVRVVSLSTTEISEVTRLKSDLQSPNTLCHIQRWLCDSCSSLSRILTPVLRLGFAVSCPWSLARDQCRQMNANKDSLTSYDESQRTCNLHSLVIKIGMVATEQITKNELSQIAPILSPEVTRCTYMCVSDQTTKF